MAEFRFFLFVMTKLLDYTGIDGSFGPQTQDAVKSFQ
jgi:peptidoglycan hydrolase-like protein with peptidoglycan-binding domain